MAALKTLQSRPQLLFSCVYHQVFHILESQADDPSSFVLQLEWAARRVTSFTITCEWLRERPTKLYNVVYERRRGCILERLNEQAQVAEEALL